MDFFTELDCETRHARRALMASPVIVDCFEQRVGLDTYRAFLTQAYHHVRHTVPLLMACGSRLPERLDWLQSYIVDYIEEEQGHEKWIWNDIAATGADANALIAAKPNLATEVMISYAYDTIQRDNPIGFFGMVYVLESTSVAIAAKAADVIQSNLKLPTEAFSYLRSHGAIDVDHISTYAEIVNRLGDERDRAALRERTKAFFKLYADVFLSLPRAVSKTHDQREVA